MDLSNNDKQRIKEAFHEAFPLSSGPGFNEFFSGYEAATRYEREQQAPLLRELEEFKNGNLMDEYTVELSDKVERLEAERSDLLAKVSEQEKEIERLHDLMGVEHCPSLPTCYAESKELDRLREERKELSIMLKGFVDSYNIAPIPAWYLIQSLLSKFEVPNQS